jgi:hypothetical protein
VEVVVAGGLVFLVRQLALLEMEMEPQLEMQGSTHLEPVLARLADSLPTA